MDAYFLGNGKGRVRRDGARDLGYQPAGERWERMNGAGLGKQNIKKLTPSFQQHLENILKSFRERQVDVQSHPFCQVFGRSEENFIKSTHLRNITVT
ncbi:hypothetical protein AVEN_126635-1 [Araneus ventricosus]|uniref:Uncharacterized protein n=1 Tax=Araneus ventricosus TaxID=182803 RepID=A0A4Y2V0Q6_ARAVE|nr:hypothetical protein AVEN_126635-1 [Araneus ventricosus]